MAGRTLWKARPGGKAEKGELEAPLEQSEGSERGLLAFLRY